MYQDQEVVIRPIAKQDLKRLWELIYKEEAPEWKRWDAPYFEHLAMSFEEYSLGADMFIEKKDMWVIEVEGTVYGTVSYYYEDKSQKWLEVGIVLHQSTSWNRGIGTRALRLWVNHLFNTLPTVRVGLTTWSGNERMMKVAQKIGMQLEGRMRKVRFFEENYYDSIRMGVLREEWTI